MLLEQVADLGNAQPVDCQGNYHCAALWIIRSMQAHPGDPGQSSPVSGCQSEFMLAVRSSPAGWYRPGAGHAESHVAGFDETGCQDADEGSFENWLLREVRNAEIERMSQASIDMGVSRTGRLSPNLEEINPGGCRADCARKRAGMEAARASTWDRLIRGAGRHSDASFRFHDRSIFSILLQDAADVHQHLAEEYIGDACRVRA